MAPASGPSATTLGLPSTSLSTHASPTGSSCGGVRFRKAGRRRPPQSMLLKIGSNRSGYRRHSGSPATPSTYIAVGVRCQPAQGRPGRVRSLERKSTQLPRSRGKPGRTRQMTRLTKCLVATAVAAGLGLRRLADRRSDAPPSVIVHADDQAVPDHGRVHAPAAARPLAAGRRRFVPRHDHDFVVAVPAPSTLPLGRTAVRDAARRRACRSGDWSGRAIRRAVVRLQTEPRPVVTSRRTR